MEIDEYTESLKLAYSTYFNWSYKAENGELKDILSKPDNSPNKTRSDELIAALKVILERLDWGGEKISQFLTREEICYLSPSTINRIKSVLTEYIDEGNFNIYQRYEFINPNDCWSLDFMEFNWKGEKLYLTFLLDDHSRYILDWGITSSATCEFVKDLLSNNFKQYGTPKVIKSDNGPQFRKQFKGFLQSWGIIHHPNPVYTSIYNGKTERKNKDIQAIIEHIEVDEKSLEELFAIIGNAFYEHNHIRPHQSLGGATPYQSYNNFDDKVRAKMEAFKKQEKERKGFKTKNEIILPNEEEKNQNQGLIVPAHLVNDPSVFIGLVKSFVDIRV